MSNVPVAVGVYVAEHTPFAHVNAPMVPPVAVADTFAFWSTASVTIPAGQTSVNATLNGRNAGTTSVYAVDGSNTAYAGDTAVLRVQASLRMTTSSYGLVATDQLLTQVLLSDPSPAGGTYVTFAYGTQGRALVSPDPAFIPGTPSPYDEDWGTYTVLSIHRRNPPS